jgi:hypothetical protein
MQRPSEFLSWLVTDMWGIGQVLSEGKPTETMYIYIVKDGIDENGGRNSEQRPSACLQNGPMHLHCMIWMALSATQKI